MVNLQAPTPRLARRWRLFDLLGGAYAATCAVAAAAATVVIHATAGPPWADLVYRLAACCALAAALWASWGTHIQIPALRSFHEQLHGYRDLVVAVRVFYAVAAIAGALAALWALTSGGAPHAVANIAGSAIMSTIPFAVVCTSRRLRVTVPAEDLWQFGVLGVGWIGRTVAERRARVTTNSTPLVNSRLHSEASHPPLPANPARIEQ